MIDLRFNQSISGVISSYSLNQTVSATALASAIETIADAATDLEVSLFGNNAAASDSTKALLIKADQDLTVKVALANDSVLQTINLTANTPYYWLDGSGVADPTWRNGGDIAKLLVTNASGASANLFADLLHDATP